MRNGQPDMVPVAPDISNMIPCRLTGKPFWEIYLYEDPPLWRAYIEAVKKHGIDGWDAGYINLGPSKEDKREFRREIVEKTSKRIVVREYCRTPEGELWQEIVYPRDNPPVVTRKYVKDMERDFKIYLKYFFPDPSSSNDEEYQQFKKEMGELGVTTIGVWYPGLHHLVNIIDGGLEKVIYAYYDHYDLIKEYALIAEEWIVKLTKRIIKAKPDYLLIGASGTLSLSSPEIFREISLPTLKKITNLAKEAGVPSLLHSCGKEKELVKISHQETDLNCINPLEPPPMGDCDLGEIKKNFGKKLALMGNIHTTEVMLKGSVEDVERAARKCIDQAKEGGGFILSTGDQCGRDTPDENIYKLVEVARSYGKY